jgi:3-oxoacyl-[acyl-carrier protein] reductase
MPAGGPCCREGERDRLRQDGGAGAAFDVTVNAISPQRAHTHARLGADHERVDDPPPVALVASPSASAGLFLASDEAAYVTGLVQPVDGGISM